MFAFITETAFARVTHAFVVCLSLFPATGYAVTFAAALDEAEWKLVSTPLECRIIQSVPFFGTAEFRQVNGEPSQFVLTSSHALNEGVAEVRVEAPQWRPERDPEILGAVPVFASQEPVMLDSLLSERALNALHGGDGVVLSGLPGQVQGATIDVGVVSVNFQQVYQDYRRCLLDLIPVSFKDIERTRISFEPNKWGLDDEMTTDRLDTIIRYVKADAFVHHIFIDGFTDDQGRKSVNLELSKRRAERVTRYLTARGVPEKKVTTRHHGERLPIAKGTDDASRALNRRVTVRIERK